MDDQQTNHSWTIDGEKILLETPPINSKDWMVLLSNVLTPMDLDMTNISAKLSRLILCKAGEVYNYKSPAKNTSGMSRGKFQEGETCSNITKV
jgi:hypothetical protein